MNIEILHPVMESIIIHPVMPIPEPIPNRALYIPVLRDTVLLSFPLVKSASAGDENMALPMPTDICVINISAKFCDSPVRIENNPIMNSPATAICLGEILEAKIPPIN